MNSYLAQAVVNFKRLASGDLDARRARAERHADLLAEAEADTEAFEPIRPAGVTPPGPGGIFPSLAGRSDSDMWMAAAGYVRLYRNIAAAEQLMTQAGIDHLDEVVAELQLRAAHSKAQGI